MADREQVLKALRAFSPGDTIWCQMREKGECDYAGEHCMARLLSDAAELLKAQEPNEDWISRKRLKDEIQYYIDEAGWGDEANKVLGWCMEFIDNQRVVKWE